jgi:hypothetical protein
MLPRPASRVPFSVLGQGFAGRWLARFGLCRWILTDHGCGSFRQYTGRSAASQEGELVRPDGRFGYSMGCP